MPRPPPSDNRVATSADREVASSNTTLNALLGRQKSWMVGQHGVPIRPTPRAPLPAVQKSSVAVLPSPAPSDEPSPVMHNQDSPTIGLSQVEARTRTSAGRPNNISENRRPPSNDQRSSAQSNPPVGYTDSNSAIGPQSQAQISREPLAQLRSEMQVHAPSPQESQTHPSPELSSTFQQQPRTAPSQWPSQIVLPQQPVVSHSQRRTISPAVSSPQMQQAQGHVYNARSQSPNYQRTGGQPVSLQTRISSIDSHIKSIGGPDLNETLEGPRLVLLRDACKEEDLFYVALHQIFCLWSLKRENLPVISGLPNTVSLQSAFTTIGTFLRTNDGLGSSELKWFSDFPSPLEDLLKTSKSYRSTLANVGVFLIKLSSDFQNLEKQCSARGYPPLMNELIERLGLFSTVLQAVISRYIRRSLGFADDELGYKVHKTFEEDKKGHYELIARSGTNRPPTEREYRKHQDNIRTQYLTLYNERNSRGRSSTNLTGSPNIHAATPMVPSNGYFQPPSNSQAPSASNTPFPFIQQNTVIHPPHPQVASQRGTQIFTGSTNLSTQPGAIPSPNLNNQHSYRHTASPVASQGSLMDPGFQRASPVMMTHNSPVIQNGPAHQFATQRSQTYDNQLQYQRQQQQQQNAQAQLQQFQQQNGPAQLQQQQWQQVHQYLQNQQASNQRQAQQHNATNNGQQFSQIPATYEQHSHLQAQAMNQRQAMRQQQNQFQITQQAAQQQHQLVLNAQTHAHQQRILQQQHLQQQQQPQQAMAQLPQAPTSLQDHRIQQVLEMNHAQRRTVLGPWSGSGVEANARSNTLSSNAPPMVYQSLPSNSDGSILPQGASQPLVPINHVFAHQHAAMPMHKKTFIPPAGFPYPAEHPRPEETTLHQAHVRSPCLTTIVSGVETAEERSPPRFYQCVKGFAIKPVKLPTKVHVITYSFALTKQQWDLIATDKIVGTHVKRPVMRTLKRGSLVYRLRCIRSKPDATVCLPQDWVVSDTAWPQTIFLQMNGQTLEIRRKTQHGKDLPVDITQYIKDSALDGPNTVVVSIPRARKPMPPDTSYFFAIEVIEVLDHKIIMDMCLQGQRIPASQTLSAIKKSLSGSSSSDDELCLVASDLSIDLADPFTARIFETPVRGNSCLHRECFDLETFLMTRNSKGKKAGEPCMIDVWKCPLCGRDARPYSLRIDDFLVCVRMELEKQGNLSTKAILIAADGTWKPKPEPESRKRKSTRDEYDSEDTDDDMPLRKKQVFAQEKKKVLEVIELDSD